MHGQLSEWTKAAGIEAGKLFPRISSAGRPWDDGVTEKLVWHVVKEFAARIPEGKRYIIPVLPEPCPVPERLRHWQYVNLSIPGGYEKLLTAIKLGQPGA